MRMVMVAMLVVTVSMPMMMMMMAVMMAVMMMMMVAMAVIVTARRLFVFPLIVIVVLFVSDIFPFIVIERPLATSFLVLLLEWLPRIPRIVTQNLRKMLHLVLSQETRIQIGTARTVISIDNGGPSLVSSRSLTNSLTHTHSHTSRSTTLVPSASPDAIPIEINPHKDQFLAAIAHFLLRRKVGTNLGTHIGIIAPLILGQRAKPPPAPADFQNHSGLPFLM
jgi:hypothetical protein